MTLDCTKRSLLKMKRYKLARLKANKSLGTRQPEPLTPIGFLSIEDGEDDDVDLGDITSFLEKDVELDPNSCKI